MVNACTPQSEPILGTGGEKKNVHWFRMQFQISLTSGKKCRSLRKVHSSDDGISLLLAMVPNLCIDKKLGFDSPRIHLYLYIMHICVHAHFLEIPSHKSHGGDWWPRHLIDSVPG